VQRAIGVASDERIEDVARYGVIACVHPPMGVERGEVVVQEDGHLALLRCVDGSPRRE